MKTTLLIMPFPPLGQSSVACSQIKAVLNENNIECKIQYLNRKLLEKISASSYHNILHNQAIAEWIFASQCFDVDDDIFLTSVDAKIHNYRSGELLYIRDLVKDFVDEIIDDGLVDQFQVIGFTATFTGQLMASFALAKRIKEKYPSKYIVIGGNSVFGKSGYECMKIPWIDFACYREGDNCFAELCKNLEFCDNPAVPGFYYRKEGKIIDAGACDVTDLSSLPVPNYDDVDFEPEIITIESTRGCWYGVKQQCTFCQLAYNGWKGKSSEKLYQEINTISEKTGVRNFDFADDLVLPSLFSDVLSRFAGRNFKFSMMIKPTLPLKYYKIAKNSGVYEWFSGIENMQSEMLNLCRKGQTPLQNITLLKWSKYYDIELRWNFLYSIPGEKEEWYRENLEIFKKLTHFQPPVPSQVDMLRSAPYVDDKIVEGIRPHRWSEILFPDYINLEDIVQSFDYDSHKHVLPLYKIDKCLNFLRDSLKEAEPNL